jgi:ATP synthase protein I
MPRRPVWRVLLLDAGLLSVAAAAAWIADPDIALAVAAGGLVFLLPQAWFAERVFRRQGARASREVTQAFYRAEAGKFLLTAAGFALAFAGFGPAQAAWLLGTYVVLHVVNSVLLALTGAI